jgi:hypothetical protein
MSSIGLNSVRGLGEDEHLPNHAKEGGELRPNTLVWLLIDVGIMDS